MNPVRNLRIRYTIGLSAIAGLICLTFFFLNRTIDQQENYARVINIAGNQLGQVNRIAFFADRMAHAGSEADFLVARQQLGRAIDQMRKNHQALTQGDPARQVPRIMTPELEAIYFDPDIGLDAAFRRYIANAEQYSGAERETVAFKGGPLIYLTSIGPFALDTALEAAVTEYETFSRSEIQRLKTMELVAAASALVLLVLEAILIFRPFEVSLRRSMERTSSRTVALAHQKARAEAANESKTVFLSTVSHELRTPLNAIVGFSEALLAGVYGPIPTGKQTERISDIHQSGRYLLDLVSDILDISAAEEGTINLRPTVVGLRDAFTDAVAGMGPGPQKANVSLMVAEDSPEVSIEADGRRIRQVLINLISNAVKFTPPGGVVVLRALVEADGRVGFSVSDNGIGMSPAEIEIARERFGQVEGPLTRSHAGTGLGLPVSIDLVELHGGTLEIDSVKGGGTTVTVLLPPDRAARHSPALPRTQVA